MTTSVTIKVNGRYAATVKQDGAIDTVVHGNYEGSPNPSGEHTFFIGHTPEHGSHSEFAISEKYIPEPQVETKTDETLPVGLRNPAT